MVRAKFVCWTKIERGDGVKLEFHPVTSGSPENALFFEYTPAGYISMETVNKAAADWFEKDKEYYIDFTPAN